MFALILDYLGAMKMVGCCVFMLFISSADNFLVYL